MAFEHLNCRPSKTDATDAIIQGLERFFGDMIDKQRSLARERECLAKDLTSKQRAFDEAQSRYESLYQTHREADVITAAIRRIVARVPDRALAIWRDDYGYAASHGSTEGIANGETLEDALTNLDARLAFVRNEDRPSVQNECAPTRDTPHQESDLKLRPIDAFEVVDMRGIAALQRRWVKSMPWRDKTPLEALALIASEIGEAVNECRGDTPTAELGTELADIVLRTFDLAEMLGIDIDSECRQKMAHNIEKGNLKGRGV